MKYYVGLDVSMKETSVCITDEKGKTILENKVETDPAAIANCIKNKLVPIEKVGLESGALSYWLIEELAKLGIPVICVDARHMANFLAAQVNKTDKNDARGIAKAMRTDSYQEVFPKSPKAVELKSLTGCRRTLVEQKVQITNSIRGFLKTYGIRLPSTTDKNFNKKVTESIASIPEMAKMGLNSLLNALECIYIELNKLTKQITGLASDDAVAKRLMTAPGVGPITAMQYIVEVDNPHRFNDPRSIGAYFGMTPRQYASGETKRQGPISKCGSGEMRTLLVEAGSTIIAQSKRWSKLKAWGMKIHRKRGFRKATMAVGRKLACILHAMWVKEKDFIYGEDKKANEESKKKTKKVALAA